MYFVSYVKEKLFTFKDLAKHYVECKINLLKRNSTWQVVINKCVTVMTIAINQLGGTKKVSPIFVLRNLMFIK